MSFLRGSSNYVWCTTSVLGKGATGAVFQGVNKVLLHHHLEIQFDLNCFLSAHGGGCGREDFQPAEPHETAGGSDEGIWGAQESQAREHREASGNWRGAGWQGQGDCHGALHGRQPLQHPGWPGELKWAARGWIPPGFRTSG